MSNGNGQRPHGWTVASLKDVCDITMGQSPPSTTYRDEPEGLPFFQGKAEFGELYPTARKWCVTPNKIAEKEDILLSIRAPVGPTNLASERCCIGRGLAALRSAGNVSQRYVLYVLRSLSEKLESLATGTTFQAVSGRTISTFALPIAPPAEQQRIVAKIEALQERSRRAREALAEVGPLLEQFRQSVLTAAFRGDLTADWRAAHPHVEPASELLYRIRAERRRRWEQAELAKCETKGQKPPKNWQDKYEEPEPVDDFDLPELPQGWVWATIDEISSHIVDCPHSTPKWTDAGKLCIRTTEFCPGRLDLANARFVSQETFDERIQRLKPQPGDILYSREGGILGISCQVPADTELCLGQRMMLMRTDVHFLSRLLMHWLNSPQTLDRVKRLTLGSASPHLNVGEVKRFPVPVAPLDEQSKLLELIESCLATPEACGQMAMGYDRQLDQLDQSILAKAFRGELVPQDSDDEPASSLLARIREQRIQHAEAAKHKQKTASTQRGNQRSEESSRPTPQQLTLSEVLLTKD
jgi:type I restriction enzyme S subunit